MSKAFLIAALDFSKAPGNEFHEWQDQEHIPERLAVPGFINGQRWVGAGDPKISVNTYDLENLDVLTSAPYLTFAYENASVRSKRMTGMYMRLMRVAAEQVAPGNEIQPDGAQALLFNAMNIPTEHEADFNAWYTQEHLPALAKVPGTLCARFFRSGDERSSHRYVAVYHLTAPEVPDSPAWRKAADTPWSARMRPHFQDRVRIVCRRYVSAN
jgi:hypothetical protein